MFSANEIVSLHDRRTAAWHIEPLLPAESISQPVPPAVDSSPNPCLTPEDWIPDWLTLVARQHRANFELWHIEDEARRPNAAEAEIAQVKRRVDAINQQRNDLAEVLDRSLLGWLEAGRVLNQQAPLHSETPGLMIDRLSILSLKIFHTQQEAERSEAPFGHRERNRARLAILNEQRADLADCLQSLWLEVVAGSRRIKLYRQLKMYNDPALNPAIYGQKSSPAVG
jgi:hypothetical protein